MLSYFRGDSSFSVLNKSNRWVEVEDISDELATQIEGANAAIFFKAESPLELLGKSADPSEPTKFLKQLKSREVVIGIQSGSFPGFPYFEALIALIPAGTTLIALKGLRDLILAWLQERREREVEIKLADGSSFRLKGANATPKNVEALIDSINASAKKRKTSGKKSSKKKLVRKTIPKALKGDKR